MKKQIFPKEFLENTNEAHQFRNSKKSKRIYRALFLQGEEELQTRLHQATTPRKFQRLIFVFFLRFF